MSLTTVKLNPRLRFFLDCKKPNAVTDLAKLLETVTCRKAALVISCALSGDPWPLTELLANSPDTWKAEEVFGRVGALKPYVKFVLDASVALDNAEFVDFYVAGLFAGGREIIFESFLLNAGLRFSAKVVKLLLTKHLDRKYSVDRTETTPREWLQKSLSVETITQIVKSLDQGRLDASAPFLCHETIVETL
jgi:hypothetical protein